MRSDVRLNTALNHQEPDKIPYDLAGTTVTGINKKAFVRAMEFKGLPALFEAKEVDPIQQIVTPVSKMLTYLQSDTRRIGARRISDFENMVITKGPVSEIKDDLGCLWKMDATSDFYYNQMSSPLSGYTTLSDGLLEFRLANIHSQANFIVNDLSDQLIHTEGFGIIADRNCAGLTEISLRLRGYENWFMDVLMDPVGVETLFDQILEYKINYWDLVIDWLLAKGVAGRVSVISECDDLGSQSSTLLEPEYLRATVIPRFGQLWRHIRKRLPHVKMFMHTCGSVRELLPDLIEAGLDILNPVQFTAANMELIGLKKDFGKDLVFLGRWYRHSVNVEKRSTSEC